MLNACARFAHNFAAGFGISLMGTPGSVSVGINTEDDEFVNWLRLATHGKADKSTPEELPGGAVSTPDESATYQRDRTKWHRGASGSEIMICCRATDDGVSGALFFRKAHIDKDGHITLIGEEAPAYGAIVTG
jgi:hypothetical protein